MRAPDLSLRNFAVTPLLFVRVPLVLSGRGLEWFGGVLQQLGGFVPAWTDYQRRGKRG